MKQVKHQRVKRQGSKVVHALITAHEKRLAEYQLVLEYVRCERRHIALCLILDL